MIDIENGHVIVKKGDYTEATGYLFLTRKKAEFYIKCKKLQDVEILDIVDWNYVAYQGGIKENGVEPLN